MKTKILLIFVLFTISLFGQFKANKDGFSIKMESEEDKNVICDFVLYYNKGENFYYISIGINLVETNKPTKIYFSTFNGNLSIPYENNIKAGTSTFYTKEEKQHRIDFLLDEIEKQILYLLASKHACFIQIYTKDTFYNFDFTKYNDKMKKNKKYNEVMARLMYNSK